MNESENNVIQLDSEDNNKGEEKDLKLSEEEEEDEEMEHNKPAECSMRDIDTPMILKLDKK